MKKLSILIAVVLLLNSCVSTKIKSLMPDHAYNQERLNRNSYLFDVDYKGYVYRYMIKHNKPYFELYYLQPVGRTRDVD